MEPVRSTFGYHLDQANHMMNMVIGKRQKKFKCLYIKRENNITKSKHSLVTPCVCLAYKLCTHQSGPSFKLNALILGHAIAIKQPNPRG